MDTQNGKIGQCNDMFTVENDSFRWGGKNHLILFPPIHLAKCIFPSVQQFPILPSITLFSHTTNAEAVLHYGKRLTNFPVWPLQLSHFCHALKGRSMHFTWFTYCYSWLIEIIENNRKYKRMAANYFCLSVMKGLPILFANGCVRTALMPNGKDCWEDQRTTVSLYLFTDCDPETCNTESMLIQVYTCNARFNLKKQAMRETAGRSLENLNFIWSCCI